MRNIVAVKKMRRVKHTLKRAAFLINAGLGRYRRTVWLIGDGRSGTTWVSDILNWDKRYRELFEPFHPWHLKAPFRMHHYLRRDAKESELDYAIKAVFEGRVLDDRVNGGNHRLWYDGLLVKDIFANLLAAKVKQERPGIKIILLLRNPFAVAVSKRHKRHWHWMKEPVDFLKDSRLVEDYLAPYVELIERCEDDFLLKQILIWAIIYFVTFRQFRRDEVYVLFYEQLYLSPEEEIGRLFAFLGKKRTDRAVSGAMEQFGKPSRVSGKESTVLRAISPIDGWREEVPEATFKKGCELLRAFGLDRLYDAQGLPRPEALADLFGKDDEHVAE